ncbi:MAG: RNA polymerase sigma factor [Saprospiraceae bacterium]|nr:RNA polymerase sigma factor [Saprospiraceae bacterium]
MKVIDLHYDLNQLLHQAIRNDRRAQKVMYQKYSPKLLSICRQYISDMHTAEDVMVTAFMKIFTNLSRFEHRGNFEGWMSRIAVNECISHIRGNKIMWFAEDNDIVSEVCNADIDLQTRDIQTMIDTLPYGCKMVFNLFVVEGYKHMEIADMLDITEGTSKSQLAYARKLLQQMLQQDKIINHG